MLLKSLQDFNTLPCSTILLVSYAFKTFGLVALTSKGHVSLRRILLLVSLIEDFNKP